MIALTHFATPDNAGAAFELRAREALRALAVRPGYVRGTLARSTDDPAAWLLLTEWADIGSYRRALSSYDVKLTATPLLAEALDLPGGFETMLDVAPGGAVALGHSDREPDQ